MLHPEIINIWEWYCIYSLLVQNPKPIKKKYCHKCCNTKVSLSKIK